MADSTLLVNGSTVRTAIINCTLAHEIVRSIGLILGGGCMTVFTLVCRTMIEISITMTPANRIVTTSATYLPSATVAAYTLCIMLVQNVAIPWTHLELTCITIESDVA